jgi:hypothetical protein
MYTDSLAFVNEVGGLEAVRTRDQVIGLDSSPEVGHLKILKNYIGSAGG